MRLELLMWSLLLAGLPSASATLVAGAEPRVSGFARDVLSGNYSDGRSIDGLPVTAIYAGDAQIFLEQTRLGELAAVLGGNARQADEAPALWLCYALADGASLWAWSANAAGEATVTMMALEAATAPADAECAASPLAAADVDFAVPSLAAPTRDVVGAYGTFAVDAQGRVGFRGELPALTEDEVPISQVLVYRLQAGRVVAVGVIEATGN